MCERTSIDYDTELLRSERVMFVNTLVNLDISKYTIVFVDATPSTDKKNKKKSCFKGTKNN
jgi:hypothetical protein